MRVGFLGRDNIIRAVRGRAEMAGGMPSVIGGFIMEPNEKLLLQGSAQFSLMQEWSVRPSVPVVIKSRGDYWLTDRRLCIACDISVPGPTPTDERGEPLENRFLRWEKEEGDRIYIEVRRSEMYGHVENRLLVMSEGKRYQLSVDTPAGAGSLLKRIPGLRALPPGTIKVRETRASAKRSQPGLTMFYITVIIGGAMLTFSISFILLLPGNTFIYYNAAVVSIIFMVIPVLYVLQVPYRIMLDETGVTMESRIRTVRLPYSEIERISPESRAFYMVKDHQYGWSTSESLETVQIQGITIVRWGGKETFVAMDPVEAQGLYEFYAAYGRPPGDIQGIT